jgi:hypothetical protein
MILFGACIPTVLHQLSCGCVCRNLTTDLGGTAVLFPYESDFLSCLISSTYRRFVVLGCTGICNLIV